MSTVSPGTVAGLRDTRWYPRFWYTIAFRWIGILVAVVGYVAAALGAAAPFPVGLVFEPVGIGVALLGIGMALSSLLAPFALLQERQQLQDGDGWYPSRWYYLMIFPTGILGFILSIIYTSNRLGEYGFESPGVN